LDEFDDELDELLVELCDEFELDAVPVVEVVPPVVSGDGFEVDPVSISEPVEVLVDPIGPGAGVWVGRVTGGVDGPDVGGSGGVEFGRGAGAFVLDVDEFGVAVSALLFVVRTAGGELFVVGTVVLLVELITDVPTGSAECVVVDSVDANGAGAGPGGPGGSTGGPPTP
jgi:hypothetical protein